MVQRTVSIKDIARAAGVSPSTVSRALHGHPRISQTTASRIRHLAQEMGYTPSLPARSLVTKDTATIGMVITQAADPFLARLVLGVEDAAQSHGYSVFLSSSYRDPHREEAVLRSFYERRVSGVVVTGSQIDDGYLDLCQRYPLPVVLTNCRTYPYSVLTDNRSGAEQAVEHLVRLGHRRIAYAASDLASRANHDRFAGYRAVLKRHGIPFDQNLVLNGDGTLAGGAQVGERLLTLVPRPTAIFCFNDVMAMGVLHTLVEAGLCIPQDCSVVGFDDLEWAAYYCPPLTTVRQPGYRLGRRAIRMLFRLIEGQENVQAEVLPAELVVRQTTGPVAV